ncbi:SusC/RagA family TonB-linked outer membrane protein [Salegentibacter sp. JZCK2]|uniref:SusC/RagA family TonB-linked outer membrane protein n=1 Tax=Salegentibacter tibetensis TaxID=2873600 RepID=UPI001CC94725|nr:SusC/RagA family TonB-linked outer membrane protein [Salegentibacter tibetensis]MBZ9729335.1 SusC/RagA family TonB-linked outer membrane protein [Salegentibacter tibetensis]
MKKITFRSLLFAIAFLCFSMVHAQQTVSGTVTDESGPLPGATVSIKGTSTGTTTDFDGNYSLDDVPADGVLIFSFVGYETQEIGVNGRSVIDVNLAGDAAELEEVILIGYGTTTVQDATGSVSSVTSEDFNKGVISSPEELIQGKTAGVQISQTSGEPGAGINVRIRGSNSIRSGNNPLFVVDGVPLTSGSAPQTNVSGIGGSGQKNPLNFLNPNDIESISILKDASATAIYGSRGANGVVIIQTKGGRGRKGTFEFNSTVSIASPASEYDLLDRETYLNALTSVGNNPDELDFGADSDFQDFYTRTVVSNTNDLSYSKSYNTGSVRASLGYTDQKGIVENTSLERLSGRLNASQRLFDDKLTLSAQLSLSTVDEERAPISGAAGSTGDLIGASITQNPTAPIDPLFNPGGNVLNPVSLLNNFEGLSESDRFLANLSAEYAITSELKGKVTVGYDKQDTETTSVFSSDVIGLNGVTGIGRGNYSTFNQENSLLEATLTYLKEFDNSVLDVVAGYSYQKFQRDGFGSEGAGFNTTNLNAMAGQLRDAYGNVTAVVDDFAVFGYGADGTYLNTIFPEFSSGELPSNFERPVPAFVVNNVFDNFDELQSYFMRANYTLAEKYLFTGTFRADGSSTFGENNRYGYFPSGAVAWQIHKEDFIGGNVSLLKLRLGAGIVGSQEGLGYGRFVQRERAAGGGISNDLNVLPAPGSLIVGDPNADLKWEETTDLNLGVDFGFNANRLSGSFNLYRKTTNDLLLARQTAAPSNGEVVFSNLLDGKVVNQGVEFSLDYDFINEQDYSFSASFNIAYNHNEVQDTPFVIPTGAIRGNGLTNAFAQQLQAGQPLFSFYMAEFTGFDDDGNPTYFDFDGNGVGDPDADKFFVGKDAIPDWNGGLSLSARYKAFDFAAYFNGQFDFYVYNATNNAFFTKSALLIGKNVTEDVLTTNENAASTVAVSTRFLERADFVRLTSTSIGYNLPLDGDNLVKSLRLSLIGQNLFLITGYSGLDPEISADTGSLNASSIPTAGIDYASYPRPRTISFGLNASF